MWRKIEDDLAAWRNRRHRKPLMLTGIRQCGKTYSLRKFGREQFSSCAYFNFEALPGLDAIFAPDFDTQRTSGSCRALAACQSWTGRRW